jgi:uncharacterized membrane protein
MKHLLSITAFLAVRALVMCTPASAQYVFTTLNVPGSAATAASGNSTHAVVGQFDDIFGGTHGFILDKGMYVQFDVPGVPTTTLNFINASGQLAGTYNDGLRNYAFFSDNGVTTAINPPGASRSQAGGLNAQGQLVGAYRDSSQKRHGFLWSKGVITTFNHPDDDPLFGTVPLGINDSGQIVGDYVDLEGNRRGFVLNKGVYTTLDVPGAVLTTAETINNPGQIVGYYQLDLNGPTHGFVLSKGIYNTVDVPGASATIINSINAKGEIAGVYTDGAGDHGFLGTPSH